MKYSEKHGQLNVTRLSPSDVTLTLTQKNKEIIWLDIMSDLQHSLAWGREDLAETSLAR